MTFEEYCKKMDKLAKLIYTCENKDRQDVMYSDYCDRQTKYMDEVIAEYEKTATTRVQQKVVELLKSARDDSETGQACETAKSEDEANEIIDTLYENFGELLLDSEVYEDEWAAEDAEEKWVVDVMFAGIVVPQWDGFWDDWATDEEEEYVDE